MATMQQRLLSAALRPAATMRRTALSTSSSAVSGNSLRGFSTVADEEVNKFNAVATYVDQPSHDRTVDSAPVPRMLTHDALELTHILSIYAIAQ